MAKVILGGESGLAGRREPLTATAIARVLAPLFLASGLLLLAVAFVDLGILWSALRFGTSDWEFYTVVQTFNALALLTMGFVFMTIAASLTNRSGWLRLLAVLAVLGCVALIAITMLFGLAAPLVMRAAPPPARPTVMQQTIRTTAFAGLFIVFYAWLSWFTWRRAGAAVRGVST